MSLEDLIATKNSSLFTREFTFSASLFRNDDGHEVELCDGAIWIDDLLMLFQIKERNLQYAGNAENELKWFRKQVEQKAVGQFVDTLRYLRDESSLPLTNRRGQLLDLSNAQPKTIHLIAIYSSSDILPQSAIHKKGRVSSRIGAFVHYFEKGNYHPLCDTLFTPAEISEYLGFRAEFVNRNPCAHTYSEKALVGKFLTDTDELNEINDEHELVVDRLVDDRNEFNVSGLLHEYIERIADGEEGIQYHAILKEIAKLPRNFLREFRKRIEWAMNRCHEETQQKPSRFYAPKQGCCFVAIPLPLSIRDTWESQLNYYSHLCKYDLQAQRCVGFAVAADEDNSDNYRIHWMFLDFTWNHSDDLQQIVSEDNPFREVKGRQLGKYRFK